mmetsp:Transcript_65834/g.122824  ORF Transcript_65834/g.122824 Transcript_65834/m.122824 type:complete len:614 (+) Transcript_65834:121-1962(+)
MAAIASIETPGFSVKAHGMDLCIDPATHTQFVSFRVALQMSVQELIDHLKVLQAQSDPQAEAPGGSADLSAAAASVGLNPPPVPFQSSGVFASAAGIGASPNGSPDAMASPAGIVNESASHALLAAACTGSAADVKLALEQRADVNFPDAAKQQRTPLHLALEAGGNPEVVGLLLEARANVNATTLMGRTAMHCAVERYLMTPPVAVRMLAAAKADLSAVDSRGASPIDMVKAAAQLAFQQQSRPDDMPSAGMRKVLQMLDELTDLPTVAVPLLDQEVRNVAFVDMDNDKVVWHTDGTIGLYSLRTQTMLFRKRLRPGGPSGHVQSCVLCVSANPMTNTVAACLEITEAAQGPQNVAIVWPNGQLQDEEPLKLNLGLRPAPAGLAGERSQAQLCLSQTGSSSPQVLVGKLGDGQVYAWRLNASRTQLLAEVKLMNLCGLIAVSDSASWIACVDKEADDVLVVLRADPRANAQSQSGQRVATIKRRPMCVAVAERLETSCLVAITENPPPGLTASVIEVLEVNIDGGTATVYRVKPESLCMRIQFCHGSNIFLASAHVDGVVALYNLQRGEVAVSHDDPEIRSMSISPDRMLVATAQGRHFRVYRSTALELTPA